MTRFEHWLSCPQKSCCSHFAVFVTGDDVVRIARRLAVEPWHFAIALPARSDADDAFALGDGSLRWRLALLRQRFVANEPPACTFLVQLPEGETRCGLGDGRPLPCRTFPLSGFGDADLSGCTCDWRGVALDDEAGHRDLDALAASRTAYRNVVARWNHRVASNDVDASLTLRDYLRFLMAAYG